MRIVHHTKDFAIEQQTDSPVGFLLTNKKGGFFSYGIASRYRGWFSMLGEDLYKIVDSIRTEGSVSEVHHHFWKVETRGNATESYFLPLNSEALVYEGDKPFEILMDIRHPYDNRVWGRNYRIITQEKDYAIIEYRKTTDQREDGSEGIEQLKMYVILYARDGEFTRQERWEEVFYAFDQDRGSFPTTRYVYNPFRIEARRLIMITSRSSEDLLEQAKKTDQRIMALSDLQRDYSFSGLFDKKYLPSRRRMAHLAAIHALDQLTHTFHERPNIYAGLPWFFQTWNRDELISITGLLQSREYSTVKSILLPKFGTALVDGNLPNRYPSTDTGTADAIGWLFLRTSELIERLENDKLIDSIITAQERSDIIANMKIIIQRLISNHTREGLATNGPQETWMDTLYGDDGRSGARIEIQALRMRMYRVLSSLTKDSVYKRLEESLCQYVRKKFWDGKCLADGETDTTIRPNLFLAAYIYPWLLSNEEWTACFDNALEKLWLEWGGLSSIDVDHPLMTWQNTGEDVKSYHHGDSWYFINNIAAIVMHRINADHFKDYIQRIIDASTEEILFSGYAGCHAEISSAGARRSEGCLSQAWSNATFIELFHELNSVENH